MDVGSYVHEKFVDIRVFSNKMCKFIVGENIILHAEGTHCL